jgi:hypothetical protein
MGLNEGSVTFSLASTYSRLPRGIRKSMEITTSLPEITHMMTCVNYILSLHIKIIINQYKAGMPHKQVLQYSPSYSDKLQ